MYFSSFMVNFSPELWNEEQCQAFREGGRVWGDFCQACMLPFLESLSLEVVEENSEQEII